MNKESLLNSWRDTKSEWSTKELKQSPKTPNTDERRQMCFNIVIAGCVAKNERDQQKVNL